MIKKIALVCVLVVLTIVLCSCSNRQMMDLTYKFDRAIILLPNGKVIEGKVEGWMDYEDSDQIQVKIDGKQYLTFISNVVLIAE